MEGILSKEPLTQNGGFGNEGRWLLINLFNQMPQIFIRVNHSFKGVKSSVDLRIIRDAMRAESMLARSPKLKA